MQSRRTAADNKSLQQTAAAIPVPRYITAHRAAAAGELVVRPLKLVLMMHEAWTWEPWVHPSVVTVLAEPAIDLGWCARLERAPTDSIVGKVVCVCAAAGITREVLAAGAGVGPAAADALALLDDWIDDPTEERFSCICKLIFPPEQSPDFDPHGLVWWALRTATSTADGYGEAAWALETTCNGAIRAGFEPDQLRAMAERAVLARRTKPA